MVRKRTAKAEDASTTEKLAEVAEQTTSPSSAPAPHSTCARKIIKVALFSLSGLLLLSQAPYYYSLLRPSPPAPPRPAQPVPEAGKLGDFLTFDLPRKEDVNLGPDVKKRDAVREAFKHAWHAYERDAWGYDDYHPISRRGSNLSKKGHGIGYTIADSLDTIQLMGLTDEFERAREWMDKSLSFDVDDEFNTFETTIRILGGLLSSHYLSTSPFSPGGPTAPDPLFLRLASDLAERLLPTFSTPSGIPLSLVNLARAQGVPDRDNHGMASTAEAASLQLEFRYLAELMEEGVYWRKAEKVMEVIRQARKRDGLVPIFISPENGQFFMSEIRLGSRGDSYYEYLLKQYLQTNRTEPVYREMYDEAMHGIKRNLMKVTKGPEKLVFTHELKPRARAGGYEYYLKQDHLVCFIAGSFLLGVTEGRGLVPPDADAFSQAQKEDWWAGTELVRTCMDTYDKSKTGLAAEIVHFHKPTDPLAEVEDWYIKQSHEGVSLIDARNILRPETVESLFLAFRLTGDKKYRAWGWRIFEAFETHAKVAGGGYASIVDVDKVPVDLEDRLETFFLSETLKYLFLLFEDSSVAPLDKVVFNTEAHILPVFNPSFPTGFS